jgi:hypothetical protein
VNRLLIGQPSTVEAWPMPLAGGWLLEAQILTLQGAELPDGWITSTMLATDPRPTSLQVAGEDHAEMVALAGRVAELGGVVRSLHRMDASPAEWAARLARKGAAKRAGRAMLTAQRRSDQPIPPRLAPDPGTKD